MLRKDLLCLDKAESGGQACRHSIEDLKYKLDADQLDTKWSFISEEQITESKTTQFLMILLFEGYLSC